MVGDRLCWVDVEGDLEPEELLEIVKKFERPILEHLERAKAKAARARSRESKIPPAEVRP